MRNILLILVTLMSAACGRNNTVPVIDSELEMYYLQFQLDAESHGVKLNAKVTEISFDDNMSMSTFGICALGDSNRYIKINRAKFKMSSDVNKTITMYHELAHCFLDKEHNDNPKSIMYFSSSVEAASFYKTNKAESLKELFL